jgi:hypothetical protein
MARSIGWFLLIAASFIGLAPAQAAQSSMHYLHVTGTLSQVSQDQLAREMKELFTGPLHRQDKNLSFSYTTMIDGAGVFFMNVLVEPTTTAGDVFLQTYIKEREAAGFHGMIVEFQEVTEIDESVELYAGTHKAGTADDEFDADSKIVRQFTLKSHKDWVDFTDRIGSSLRSQNNADLIRYLGWFFGNESEIETYKTDVLSHDNVLMADLAPILKLKDGTYTGSGMDTSPFFDMPFVRFCWQPDYENGACYGPH